MFDEKDINKHGAIGMIEPYIFLGEIPEVQNLAGMMAYTFTVKRVGVVTYVTFTAISDYAASVLSSILKAFRGIEGISYFRRKRKVTIKIIHDS